MHKTQMGKFIIGLFILLVLFLAQEPTGALAEGQPTPDEDAVNAIARQLYCPVCENIPLDVCDTEACKQWRNLIRQKLDEGKNEDEIIEYFADQYGVRVLSVPPAAGFNWFAYLVPPIAFLIGAFLLFRAFQIWKSSPQEPSDHSTVPPPEDNYGLLIEEELRKRM